MSWTFLVGLFLLFTLNCAIDPDSPPGINFHKPTLVSSGNKRPNGAYFTDLTQTTSSGQTNTVVMTPSVSTGRLRASFDMGETWVTVTGKPPPVASNVFPFHANKSAGLDFGDLPKYSSFQPQPGKTSFSTPYSNLWMIAADNTLFYKPKGGPGWTFEGLPYPVISLRVVPGGYSLVNDTWVASVAVWFGKDKNKDTVNVELPYPCCNLSVVSFTMPKYGLPGYGTWKFSAMIAEHFPGSQEGPNENSMTLMADKKTLLCVMRVDGGDGHINHTHTPYIMSISKDKGRTWSPATSMPHGIGSARPKLLLWDGVLLLSGGRPGLWLWVSYDGYGHAWKRYSIPEMHNKLVGEPSLKYCKEFVNQQPPKQWMISTAYTSLLLLNKTEAMVCYDKWCGGSGGYHQRPPAQCTDCSVKAALFCMRLTRK